MAPASPQTYKRFISTLTTTTGKWAGRPFELRPFQENIIDRIFRRERDEEGVIRRAVREAVIGVGRKNGKTELIAALALASLVIEGERGGLVVIAAAKREQAALLLTAAKRMVHQSKINGRPMADFIKVRRDHIYFPELDAKLMTIAADAQKEHGLNPHLVIVDEGHATMQKDRELYDTLLTAQGAREDPLAIVITTAGPAPTGPMYDLYKYGREIQEGKRQDPHFEFIWYEAPEGAAVDDETAWKAANPALGEFLPIEFFRKTARAVMSGRMPEFMFRRLHMNQWTSAHERWLPFSKIEAGGRLDPHFPEGCEVTIGLDAAISRDTFGVVMIREDDVIDETNPDPLVHVRAKRFVPDVEGGYIDPDEVVTYILGLGAQFYIRKVVYDPAYMQMVAVRLSERGIICEPFPQSAAKMERATEVFQRLFLDERIIHGNDSNLLDHIAAIAVKPTERGVRMSKLKALMPTDLAVALAMCLDDLYGEEIADDFAMVIS